MTLRTHLFARGRHLRLALDDEFKAPPIRPDAAATGQKRSVARVHPDQGSVELAFPETKGLRGKGLFRIPATLCDFQSKTCDRSVFRVQACFVEHRLRGGFAAGNVGSGGSGGESF